MFIKIKLSTFENIGSGPIHLPEEELHTNASWVDIHDELNLGTKTLEQVLIGIANVLKHVVPVLVMCDRNDVHVVPQIKAAHSGLPTLYMYDRYPGGIGLSEEIYKRFNEVITSAISLIKHCPCEDGCPSCIGNEVESINGKQMSIKILEHLL